MALPYFTDRARESSSSTGTGAFTLGGSFPGYQTFTDGGAEGQSVDYAIEAVDADGNPTGQWETGKGAYSAGVLTRTTPEDGSEALPVDFAAGSKNVFITVTAATFDMLLANVASGTEAVALSEPSGSTASGYRGAAFGFSSTATGDGSTALGSSAYAPADYATAIGYNAYATGVNSSAFGFAAYATEDDAVALGHGSSGDVANAVSIGSTGSERRIVHVADGINPTDAATVGQLTSVGDFFGPASSTDNAIVRFDGTGGKTGQDSGVTVSDVSGSSVTVASTAGNSLAVTSTAPAQTTTAQAGTAATFRASDAVAGSSVAGAAAGGEATLQGGDAKRLTSGNADGGAVRLKPGAGIGTGVVGQVLLDDDGTTARPALAFDIGGNKAYGWSYSGGAIRLSINGILAHSVTSTFDNCNNFLTNYKRNVAARTSDATETTTAPGGTQAFVTTNEGATTLVTRTLPTAASGNIFRFACLDTDGIKVAAGSGDEIRVRDKVTAAAGYIQSTTVGSYVELVAMNATTWLATVIGGVWTDGTFTYDDTSLTTP